MPPRRGTVTEASLREGNTLYQSTQRGYSASAASLPSWPEAGPSSLNTARSIHSSSLATVAVPATPYFQPQIPHDMLQFNRIGQRPTRPLPTRRHVHLNPQPVTQVHDQYPSLPNTHFPNRPSFLQPAYPPSIAIPPEAAENQYPSDSDSGTDDVDTPTPKNDTKRKMKEKSRLGGARQPGACDACKQSKVRCVFPAAPHAPNVLVDGRTELKSASSAASSAFQTSAPNSGSTANTSPMEDDPWSSDIKRRMTGLEAGASAPRCRRCIQQGTECHVSGRKQKPRPPSHNELLRRVEGQEVRLLALLLHNVDIAKDLTLQSPVTARPLPHHNPSQASQSHPANAAPPHISLSDLPPLPVWEKRASKQEVDDKVQQWIHEAKDRIDKLRRPSSDTERPNDSSGGMAGIADVESDFRLDEEEAGDKGGSGAGDIVLNDVRRMRQSGEESMGLTQLPSSTRPKWRMPEILEDGIISLEEGSSLFALFYENINMFFSICDPALHTLPQVLKSSSFLFTTICAIASRYYTPRPDLYDVLFEKAKRAAGKAINGPKTVETCQAYAILGVYFPPAPSFREDRAFFFHGLANRIATDLELYRPQQTHLPLPGMPESEARKQLNRGRVWLNLFCVDRSIATQLGKPAAIIVHGDIFPFDVKSWYKCSSWNQPSDFHLCAYTDILVVMSNFHDFVDACGYRSAGEKEMLDLDTLQSFADRVEKVGQEWMDRAQTEYPIRTDKRLAWRDNLLPFCTSYAKLVILSLGLWDGERRGLTHDNPFSRQCIRAAMDVLNCVVDKLAPLGYMRYIAESYFVFMGFAAAFLLKILRPRFSFMHRLGLEDDVINLVQHLIALLNTIATDRLTAKLYARFLSQVVQSHKKSKSHKQKAKREETPDDTTPTPLPLPSTDRELSFAVPVQQTANPNHPEYTGFPASMDLDPYPPRQEDTILSLQAIADPNFWEHAAVPHSFVTNHTVVDHPFHSLQGYFAMGSGDDVTQMYGADMDPMMFIPF